ncbi:MAG: non-canonical purine NTP pyrophosphatase, partial [Oscillospiraceae bacterium]
YLKANVIYKLTKLATISDDSGICVDALDGKPGIFSARYGGDECKSDAERTNKLLSDMKNQNNRDANFHCDICLITQRGKVFHFTGDCYGKIGYKVCGANGFGYDPIFMIGEKSFSQLTNEQKDEISHRGIALRKLQENFDAIMKEENL